MTLSTDDIACLRRQIKLHEGFMPHAYQDSQGYWTIGFGRCIDKEVGGGITVDEAYWLLDNDLDRCHADMQSFSWYHELAGPRKHAILEMRFQLGPAGFRKFRNMIAAIPQALVSNDWTTVADEMLNSAWHTQTPRRCEELAAQMRNGSYP